jgi:hypothetical protein
MVRLELLNVAWTKRQQINVNMANVFHVANMQMDEDATPC